MIRREICTLLKIRVFGNSLHFYLADLSSAIDQSIPTHLGCFTFMEYFRLTN